MNAAERMTRTRTRLLLDHPWFGSLAMRLKIVADESIPTMSTDGTTLSYNPAFVEKQTDAHLMGIMAHEVLHVVLLHPYRRGSRDKEQWNVACDHMVNLDLVAAGFQLPADCIIDKKYAGLSADVIYAQLGNEPKPKGENGKSKAPLSTGTVQDAPQSSGNASSKSDSSKPANGAGEPSKDAGTEPMTEEDWKIAAEQASSVARAAGKLPGDAARSAKNSRDNPEDWRAILREFIEHTTPSDYSWSQPNRRHIADGLYLPSIFRENTGKIAILIDTSGSISQKILDSFACEVTAIMHEARPEEVLVVYCDTRVRHTDTFTPDDEKITLTCHGGGGTKFAPAFDHLNTLENPPIACIYFTDLENSSSERLTEPNYPVLWATGKHVTRKPAFGEVIRIDGF